MAKKNLIKKTFQLLITLLLGVFIGFSTGILIDNNQQQIPLDHTNEPFEINLVGVAGSGSMLPVIYPEDLLEYTNFSQEDNPKCGHIYIYQLNESTKVVHRFSYETNSGLLLFKGDNNRGLDDPINKSQIKYEVIGVNFK